MRDEPDLFAPIRRDEIGEIVSGFGFLFLWMPAVSFFAFGWPVLGMIFLVLWAISMPAGMWLDWKLD